MAVPPYRVLVVDDSAFMRKLITDMVSEDPRFTVIATARNGRDGLEKVKSLRPDAVTMDVEMPEMNGIEALVAVMKEAPTKVIMLSSLTDQGADMTIKALELGAFDFVHKPSGSISLDLRKVQEDLTEKLFAACVSAAKPPAAPIAPNPPQPVQPPQPQLQPQPQQTKSQQPPQAKQRSQAPPSLPPVLPSIAIPHVLPQRAPRESKPTQLSPQERKSEQVASARSWTVGVGGKRGLIAIGTSTGGPKALQSVLTGIPADYPFPLVIVQHMPPGFTKSLAQRLNTLCAIGVAEAEDRSVLKPGLAYIAPGGRHMKVLREADQYVVRLSDEPPRNGHRPSVDVLFESVAELTELDITAVVMTGMGSDGARGMKLLSEKGVKRTIAEHESTCVVYGMPRAAVEIGQAAAVVPLERISGQLLKAANYPEEV
jgi:two-component system, chemotaxis family, protein-glutamate methylesterase/glutaminase